MEIHLFMLEEKDRNLKVAFIQGRPSGHPIHVQYAKLLNADFYFEDRIVRWLEKKTFKLKRYLSWVLNAIFFPNRQHYDVFFCECLRVPPLLMKLLGFLRKEQKLIALMADESLYFYDKKRYSKITSYLFKLFLDNCDGIICIGDLQYDLAIKHVDASRKVKIVKIYNGLSSVQINKLNSITRVNDDVIRFLVIANLSADWRVWYKGVDIAIEAFSSILRDIPNSELHIVGSVDASVKEGLLINAGEKVRGKIVFTGMCHDITLILHKYDLCVHAARGDAFPTSTIECMLAGIPVIVSTETGTKSLMENVDSRFVVDLNSNSVKNAVMVYLKLNNEEKEAVRSECKRIASKFDEEKASEDFLSKFHTLVS